MSTHEDGKPQAAAAASPAPAITLRQRRTACANSKWLVYFDAIAGIGGQTVDDYLVLSPRTKGAGDVAGVCVLPVLADGRVVLLRNYRHPLKREFWECARGFIDPAETPETAAMRELAEETGLVCPADKLVALGHVAQEPSTLAGRVALFAALDCRPQPAPIDDEPGLGAAHAFTLDVALRMAADSEIEDATTLIALYRHAARRSA